MSSVHADKGWLFIAFRLGGRQVRLYLGLRDTRANRRSCRKAAAFEVIALKDWATLAAQFPSCKHLKPYAEPLFRRDTTTFREAAARFLAYQALTNKPATVTFYRTIIETHITGSLAGEGPSRASAGLPLSSPGPGGPSLAFADKPIRLIGASDIAALYGPVAQRGHTPQAQKIRRVVSAVFQWARGERGSDGEYLVADNPVTRTRPIIVERDEEDEVDPFTADEVERIIAACRPGWERRLVSVAFETGLRISENFGLKRADIDLGDRVLRIRQTWSRFGEGAVKNRRSRRSISLSADAARALREQLADIELRSPWLWPVSASRPKPHNPQNFSRRHWPAILKSAGVEHRSLYQCRHTYATRLLATGAEVRYIADQMGHANLEMLIDHYWKWRQGSIPKPMKDLSTEELAIC
jgi:integrase